MLPGIVPFHRPTRWRRLHAKQRRLRVREQTLKVEDTPESSTSKFVSHGTREDVTVRNVKDSTFVKGVGDPTPYSVVGAATVSQNTCQHQHLPLPPEVVPKEVVTSLHKDVWRRKLSSHPDRVFADEILDFIENGVPLYYDGPLLNQQYPNWKSCDVLRNEVKTSLLYDVSRRWKVGPFPVQPFQWFVSSPMGAFSKPSGTTVKTRVIHDLSWPPGRSVNFYIPAEMSSVQYVTVADAVRMVKVCGEGCRMGKLDLKDAYKQIGVRKKDWPLLGSSWVNDFGQLEFYFDTVLPFGCRSSAAQFNKFATALEYVMLNDGVSYMCHYLDDMFTCGSAGTLDCYKNMELMEKTCL
jgi:hypothetical protein